MAASFDTPYDERPSAILVIGPAWVGDMVMAQSLFRALKQRWPDRVIDVQALAGDSVDNIPGAPGIGVKTAALLINEFGDLDTLLDRAEEIRQPKRRQTLIENRAQIELSRRLVTLDCDTPVEVTLDDLEIREPEAEALLGFLRAMEFRTVTRRVAEALGIPSDVAVHMIDWARDWLVSWRH